METFLPLALLVLTVPLAGGLAAATPYLMPKRECFAVTVPEGAHADPQIKALKSRYARTVAALTAAFTLVAALATAPLAQAGSGAAASALVGVVVLADLLPVAASFALMLRNRRRVMAIKRERGWLAPRQQASALVVEDDVPGPISLAWNLLYLPVALLVAALGALWYPLMPDMIPMHVDFAGNVNSYSPRDSALAFPLAMVAFLGAVFVFSHWTMTRSKRPTNPAAPMTSAVAYGLFARAQSIFLLACGLFLSLAIGVTFMAMAAGFVTLGGVAAIVCAACVPVVAGSIALAAVYGQNGSRLLKRLEEEKANASDSAATGANAGGPASGAARANGPACMPFDDDEHWKLGIFYFNPDDASLWLPERFGIGWTMNFARPAAWALVGGLVLFAAAFIALVFALVG